MSMLMNYLSVCDLTKMTEKAKQCLHNQLVAFKDPVDLDFVDIYWDRSRRRAFKTALLPLKYELGIYKIGPKQVKKKRRTQNEKTYKKRNKV